MNLLKKYNLHKAIILSFLFLLFIVFLPSVIAQDSDNDGLTDEVEKSLSEKYSPILYFEKGENFYPVNIEYHLQNSNLNQSVDGEDLINSSPTISMISNYTDPNASYYLDNKKGTINDDGIKKDYKSQKETLGYTIYSHVTKDSIDGKEYVIVQYWMFYIFNEGPMNSHEGDWEMVQVILDSSNNPIESMYSQHIGGQKTEWSNVEKEGDNIKVYVAKGSHANYFRSYQGKMSLSNDIVNDNGKVLKKNDYNMVLLGELGPTNHISNQDWMDYGGLWGDFGSVGDELQGKRGIPGPGYREEGKMWNTPLEWGDDLQSVGSNTFKINWFFYNFILIYIAIAIISIVIKLLIIKRRHKKTGLGSRIFSILYIDGFNLKSIGNLVCIVGMIVAIISLFFPWYALYVDIDAGSYSTDGEVKVLSIDGSDGVQISKLESNSGLVQLFAFPIPFAIIIGLGIFFIILSSVGILKSSKLGRKYISGGIKLLIPIIIILIIVAMIASILAFSPVDVPEESKELIETISESPIKGEKTKVIEEYGTVDMKWGIETGGFLLSLSGILLLIGGILEIIAKQEFFKPKSDISDIKKQKSEDEGIGEKGIEEFVTFQPIPDEKVIEKESEIKKVDEEEEREEEEKVIEKEEEKVSESEEKETEIKDDSEDVKIKWKPDEEDNIKKDGEEKEESEETETKEEIKENVDNGEPGEKTKEESDDETLKKTEEADKVEEETKEDFGKDEVNEKEDDEGKNEK